MTTTKTRFALVDERYIPEVHSHASLYRHLQTGAEVLSLSNTDENKCFGITFRTPPSDSTGVAHILEHSVLCGSRKYPLKEPFVELLKGSLKTFLNAFTFPDKTCYPVASQNTQDFYNLIDVYLDAVFHPRLTPHIFAQEGWHYELDSPTDEMIYKGVVFNEMKGAYSSPDRLLGELVQESLYPDITYGVSAAGDPRHIPDLTYEQLTTFHGTLYHPSNARIFFYGDDDPDTRLDIIAAYLDEFEPLENESAVGIQSRFDVPRRSERGYSIDADQADEARSYVAVNWMLIDNTDVQAALTLDILASALVGTPGAPLRKALLDSGLGEDLTGSGYVDSVRQGYFTVGLKGIAADQADAVEELVLTTLVDLATNGLHPDTVEATLNTYEFRLREYNTGSFPRGLAMMIGALNSWLHDKDPFAALAFEAPLAAIKEQIARGEPVFERLIQEHFLNNPHRTTVVLHPDATLARQHAEAERARLNAARTAMSDEEIAAVIAETHLLRELQEKPDSPEALATIPSLTLADLERQNKTIPLEVDELHGTRVLFHDQPTSGIVYLDVGLNLHALPQELLPYGELFGTLLLEMGTEHADYVELSQRIGRKTGGIGASSLVSAVREQEEGQTWLLLRGKATVSQADELLAILRDVLLHVQLDNYERFRQIVLEEKAGLERAIIPHGHMIVMQRLSALFNETDWADEQMSGVSFLFFLRELAQELEHNWPLVRARLENVRRALVNRSTMVCNVTVDAAGWRTVRPQLASFLDELPAAPPTLSQWNPAYGAGFEGLTLPTQVNYVGQGGNLYALGYRYHGSLSVISKYLRTSWLWEKIRVQGGAYGAFCRFDRHAGVWCYGSYRDPNLARTLEVYNQTGAFLRRELSRAEVERSIIGAIGDIDAYQLPDAKGYTSLVRHLVGDDDATRQQIRDEVLGTTPDHFYAFADTLDALREQARIVVLGSGEAIDKAAPALPQALVKRRVL